MNTSPLRGALVLCAAMSAFACSDALAKHLAPHLAPPVLAWCRYIALLATVLPLALRERAWRSSRPGVQAARAAALVGSALFFLWALRSLPVAEATAMVFASPLFITLLAAFVLHERVPPSRWWPVTLGFVGVLIVVRPGHSAFGWAALLPLASSICWATAVTCTRSLGATDRMITTMFYSGVFGAASLTLLLPAMDWRLLADHLPAVIAMAVAWSSAQWLTVWAYRLAPAASIAPFAYTQLLWAMMLGWLAFSHVPDAASFAGIAVILASGLMAAWQGRRLHSSGA